MAMMGKDVRLARLVNPKSNKMMAITVDHAISRGIAPMTGLHDIQGAIDKIVAGKPDAMTMTKGIQERCWGPYVVQVFLYYRKFPIILLLHLPMILYSDV